MADNTPSSSQPNSANSSTNSSLQSWQRFHLDPKDKRKILVYEYRSGVGTSSQEELCLKLEKDPTLRCSKLAIPSGHRRIEVHQIDLYPDQQREEYANLPNSHTSLASIMLPPIVYWTRMLAGKYREMYIVSHETSPGSTPSSSFHESQNGDPLGFGRKVNGPMRA